MYNLMNSSKNYKIYSKMHFESIKFPKCIIVVLYSYKFVKKKNHSLGRIASYSFYLMIYQIHLN